MIKIGEISFSDSTCWLSPDNYAKSIQNLVGLKLHDGPYTFKEFEKYLYSKFKIFNHLFKYRKVSLNIYIQPKRSTSVVSVRPQAQLNADPFLEKSI